MAKKQTPKKSPPWLKKGNDHDMEDMPMKKGKKMPMKKGKKGC